MAQRVIGIDLGAHSVKIAELEIGFRSVVVSQVRTYEVVDRIGKPLVGSIRALAGRAIAEETDIVCAAMPGDRVLLRMLDIPFADPRKVAPVIANELADDLPWEVEDLIYDHVAAKPGEKVLVAASHRDEIREMLELLGESGIEPRQLEVAPLSYAGVVRRLYPEEHVAVLDIGHMRTNVCLIGEGRARLARAISRGGHQITDGLRRTFQLGYAEAEQFKHMQALVVDDPEQLDARQRRIATATAEAIAPLVREVKRTLSICAEVGGQPPQRVLLCGGTSLLAGIDSYLAVELGLPVERLTLGGDEALRDAGLDEEGEAISTAALSLALDYGRRERLDFRRGEFAFKTDTSLFREKARALGVALVAILLFAGVSAYASLYAEEKQHVALERELSRATRRVFGKPITNPHKVSKKVKKGLTGKKSGISTMSAVDVLDIISKKVPARDDVKLDITRMDIKPGKTYLRGTADSRSAVGKIARALEGHSCFSEVSTGRISDVQGDKKQFSLTIKTKCF